MKKFQSEALMVLHQDAEGLRRLGIISDTEMKKYDEGCLVKEPNTTTDAEDSAQKEHVAV